MSSASASSNYWTWGSEHEAITQYLSAYAFPLAVGITAMVGGLSYKAYQWYLTRADQSLRAHRLLVRAKSAPGELPLQRPIIMGNEDVFRGYIKESKLPIEIKKALCRDGVYVGNPERVVALLDTMITEGAEKFQVVTDFDATLTRYHREGRRCDSSYGILDSNSMVPQWFRDESDKLRKKYYAIELDPLLTIEEKTPHMKNWWTKAHDLLIQTGLQMQWLPKMVLQSSVELRDRTGVLFAMLDHYNIPLLIYSAGIGDLIKEVLVQKCSFRKFSQQPMIVANYMKFDDKGQLTGFSDELIHTFNKHEIFPHHLDYFAKHDARRNVLLMGDMLGDLRMADGMSAKENVITIGFLNSKVQDCFASYLDSFDVILLDDQTMDIPIAIVESVIKSV